MDRDLLWKTRYFSRRGVFPQLAHDSAHCRRQKDLNEVAYGHGHRERDILWSSVHLLQRGSPLAEGHQGSCKRFIAKGIYSSSIAASTGPFLQVAPIESAAARMFFPLCEDLGPRHLR